MAAHFTARELIDMIDTNESDDTDGEFVESDSDDDPDFVVPLQRADQVTITLK